MNIKKSPNLENQVYKVIIIGSGPAGLTAAIYAARAGLNPLVIAGQIYGGQLMTTTEVENYPGFPNGIQGPELMQNMITQAEKFGAQLVYKYADKVEFQRELVDGNLPLHKIYTGEEEYKAHAVVVATGAASRKLGVPGEKELWGRGVSTCATCDGAFYRDKIVAVVGGGDSAMEEANFLTRFANKVYLIHRSAEFKASKIMLERARKNPHIEFITDTIITEIVGQDKVEKIVLKNTKNDKTSELEVAGLFLAIGYIPETEIFSEYLTVDAKGYAVPKRRTYTNVPGVFIAGDVEDSYYRQAITAAADGCKAAIDLESWLQEAED